MVKPVPEGYHAVTPYLIVSDAGKAIEFYKRGLGAQEIMRMPGPGGRIMHAEVKIGDSIVMLGEEPPDKPTLRAPQAAGLQTASLYLYVPNVDTAFKRALDAGAKAVQPVTDMFWGDRIAQIADPSGHQWTLATHKEDLTPEEIGRRQKDFLATVGAQQKKKKQGHARDSRQRDHRRGQEALHGGEPRARAGHAPRLRPSAPARALARGQAGAPDPEGQRGDGADQTHPVLPGHGLRRLLRRAGPGRARHRGRPVRRPQ